MQLFQDLPSITMQKKMHFKSFNHFNHQPVSKCVQDHPNSKFLPSHQGRSSASFGLDVNEWCTADEMIRGVNVWYSMKNPEMLSRKMAQTLECFTGRNKSNCWAYTVYFETEILKPHSRLPNHHFYGDHLPAWIFLTLQSPSRKHHQILLYQISSKIIIIKDHPIPSNIIKISTFSMVLKCQVEKNRAGMPGPVPPNSALLPEMPHRLKSKQIQDSSRFLELPRGDIFTNYRPRQTPVLPEALLLALN